MEHDGRVTAETRLLVPVKPLHRAKTRLLRAFGGSATRTRDHAEFVTAAVLDTVTAARRCTRVAGVVVVTSDPALTGSLTDAGVEVVPDTPGAGLNEALRHGERVLRGRTPTARIGALQADLPALRPGELDAALCAAGSGRAFCADRHRTGTTLLLSAAGGPLDPRFGGGSAAAHEADGATRLDGPWPSLRCDVDTEQDLRVAAELGLGAHTRARLRQSCPA